MEINVEQVLKSRLPVLSKFIPGRLIRRLESFICQDELNRLLMENAQYEGADFARSVLKSLDVTVDVVNAQNLPDPSDRRVLFVCNHPLGGLDGMALIDIIQRHYGGQVWFVVNDLLSVVEPLNPVFLPINKFGKQARANAEAIDRAFAGNDPIIMFPAGMVSRLKKHIPYKGQLQTMVVDLEWQKMFITKCIQHKRDFVPLFFSGTNSMRFYRMANRRTALGLKFNFEMIYLPSEMIRARGKNFKVYVGDRRSYTTIKGGRDARNYAMAAGADCFMLYPEQKGQLPDDY